MIFPTVEFFVFFLVALSLNWYLKKWPTYWKAFLFFANCIFYSIWGGWFVSLMLFIALANYLFGVLIDAYRQYSKTIFLVGIIMNILLLSYFKYYDFFRTVFENSLGLFGIKASFTTLYILLPVGMSFYIFRGMSYLFDIYRNKYQKEENALDFCIYMSFFPQLLSGPIARADQFLPQIKDGGNKELKNINDSVYLIVLGLFKKLIISSWLVNLITDGVFSVPQSYSVTEVWLAIFAYSIVIYCDFSGYSDMAIGVAGLMGFESPPNFLSPYLSLNLQDFWRKWHISLSNWFRDYLYIPLGGNRVEKWRQYMNIMIVMVVSGLWHGAGYTFLLWGFLHGLGMIASMIYKNPVKTKYTELKQWLYTFIFISLAWVPFRAESIANAFDVYAQLFSFKFGLRASLLPALIYLAVGIYLIFFEQKLKGWFNNFQNKMDKWLRPVTVALIVVIIIELSPDLIPPFIYFNF